MFNNLKKIIELRRESYLTTNQIINNRFKVYEMIGIGSYGISYFALDLKNNSQCVIKQARKSKLKTPKAKLIYQREQNILRSLHHPNIPLLLDTFQTDDSIFSIMEYIPGKTFEDLIFKEDVTYDEEQSFVILNKILNIVHYVHLQGIVHRDLRIPNIIMHNQELFIIDFGLARYLHESDDEKYKHEEKRLQREIHVRSDFYSLGHFLLFLLYSGYTPNSKRAKSWEEELHLTKMARIILRRMLQLDEPYQHIEEINQDFQRYFKQFKGGK